MSDPGEMVIRRMMIKAQSQKPKDSLSQNPFRAQHARLKTEKITRGNKTEKLTKNLVNSALPWLLGRKDGEGRPLITEVQFEAGETLSRDYEYAGMLPRTTAFYDGVPISGKVKGQWREVDPNEAQIAAKQRVNKALEYVGPGLSDILVRVCCLQEGLEQAEKQLAWPNRSGKVVLKIALDRLADYYGKK